MNSISQLNYLELLLVFIPIGYFISAIYLVFKYKFTESRRNLVFACIAFSIAFLSSAFPILFETDKTNLHSSIFYLLFMCVAVYFTIKHTKYTKRNKSNESPQTGA